MGISGRRIVPDGGARDTQGSSEGVPVIHPEDDLRFRLRVPEGSACDTYGLGA